MVVVTDPRRGGPWSLPRTKKSIPLGSQLVSTRAMIGIRRWRARALRDARRIRATTKRDPVENA